ncbi:MAG: enoyl-CoA hydratase-related protein [Pseudomonadota bacterium]
MTIELQRDGALAVITIERAASLNALNASLIEAISGAIDEVAASDARALLILGAGNKAFSAGADIKELMNRDMRAQRSGTELGQSVFAKLDRLNIPSIAVIHGYALGGGLELAMACTFRVATPQAKMGLPEVRLGLIPGYGGTQRLPRLVGESRALDLVMSGRVIDAAEAFSIGLVNQVVEAAEPLAMGRAFAARFLDNSLTATLFARRAVQRALSVPLDEGLKIEADLVTLAFQTADANEGMAAFVDKRAPVFRGA